MFSAIAGIIDDITISFFAPEWMHGFDHRPNWLPMLNRQNVRLMNNQNATEQFLRWHCKSYDIRDDTNE